MKYHRFRRNGVYCKVLCLLLNLTGLLCAISRGETISLDNSELKVVVTGDPGTISVKDKTDGWTWRQYGPAEHSEFTHFTRRTPDELAFNTIFQGDPDLPVRVTLHLEGRNLTATANVDDPNVPLDSFDFLAPFQPGTNMSLVVPDFCDGHLYPCGMPEWPVYHLDSVRILNLPMPWAGVVDLETGRGYAMIYDTPCDAQLKLAAVKGLRAPRAAWNGEKGRFGYARSLTWSFTSNGGYVALAEAYRDIARQQGLLVTLQTKALTRTNITRLYGAPVFWDFGHDLSDAELQARGVAHAVHHVERWDGGRANREKLDLANQLGFVTEEYDYYLGGPLDGGTQRYQDYHLSSDQAVRGRDGQLIYIGDSSLGHIGLRCPEFYIPVAQKIIPNRLKAYPQTARYFDQITQNFYGHDNGPRGGGSTEECYAPEHPGTRRDWVQKVDQFYQYAANTLGLITGAELGKYHQVPYTELFFGQGSWFWPWPDASFPNSISDTNAWEKYREWALNPAVRVPLWELVFHDCAEGLWYPWDGNDTCYRVSGWYQDRKDAFNVLYGTPAVFLVNNDHDSEYFQDPSRWLQSYRNTCKVHEVLADREMVAHRFLTADREVQATEWSDGTRVVANFGPQPYRLKTGWWSAVNLTTNDFWAKGSWGEVLRVWDKNSQRTVTHIRVPRYRFDDAQTCAGQVVKLAQWQRGTNSIRVNVDEIKGMADVKFIIHPGILQKNWDWASTQAFACDPQDGHRLRPVAWTKCGGDGMLISGLSGWIVMDVICRESNH